MPAGPSLKRARAVPSLVAAALLLAPGAAPLAGQAVPDGRTDTDASAAPPATRPDVRRIELPNGLRVLLLPRRGAPTTSFVMRFGVGGMHEAAGSTGIAHLLEHMLFKGTETIGTTDPEAERALFRAMDARHEALLAARARGDTARVEVLEREIAELEDEARGFVVPNEFDRILSRAGARGLNATTSNEATTYFVELPSARAELFFALEADRMANPVFREFYAERDVVMEERRMRVETSPGGALYEAHLRAAFEVHPYGQPVVGTMQDLRSLSRAGVDAYYRRFYGPENAVLAVVGHFEPDEVARWAEAYLGGIAPGETPPPVSAVEPPQTEERRVELPWDARPALRIGWHVPEAAHPDAPALAVLSSLLTGGRTSRLHRRLVTEERIAASIFSTMGPGSLFPRLFQIDTGPIHPATTATLEDAIYEEIERIAEEGPTDEEVDRVRTRISAGSVRRMRSNLGLAFQLAEAEALYGDWVEAFRAAERLQRVTAEDVRRVAARYLTESNRTVAVLVPETDR